LPKTYLLINETWEYFKPKIQVESDSHDKEIVTEIFIRNFFGLKKFKYNTFKNEITHLKRWMENRFANNESFSSYFALFRKNRFFKVD